MAISTLDELKTAVQDYLTDDDVSGAIETHISLAEVRFTTELPSLKKIILWQHV